MNINITAHDILGHLSKNKLHVYQVDDTPTYRLLMYNWESFESICKVFDGRDPKEIRYSIEELIKNGHIEKQPSDNWKEVRAIESGEIAFEKAFYVKLEDKERADKSDNFQKRHWVKILLAGIILGAVITKGLETLIDRLLPKESQSIEVQKHPTKSIEKDSTATEKK